MLKTDKMACMEDYTSRGIELPWGFHAEKAKFHLRRLRCTRQLKNAMEAWYECVEHNRATKEEVEASRVVSKQVFNWPAEMSLIRSQAAALAMVEGGAVVVQYLEVVQTLPRHAEFEEGRWVVVNKERNQRCF